MTLDLRRRLIELAGVLFEAVERIDAADRAKIEVESEPYDSSCEFTPTRDDRWEIVVTVAHGAGPFVPPYGDKNWEPFSLGFQDGQISTIGWRRRYDPERS